MKNKIEVVKTIHTAKSESKANHSFETENNILDESSTKGNTTNE
jgi:hypothetical protein